MKKPLYLLFVFSLISVFSYAQNHYTVHVGTFLDAKPQQFNNIRPLGFVYAFQMDGNLFQVYLGGYQNRSDAESAAQQLKARGYASTTVQERPLSDGQNLTLIQMATRSLTKSLDWQSFEKAGDLFAVVNNDQIKIMTGIYPSIDAAKKDLNRIRSLGFADAFVKNANNVQLIRITEFESGLKKALIPLAFGQTSPARTPQAINPPQQPATSVNRTPASVPSSYDSPGGRLTAKSPLATQPEYTVKTIANEPTLPNIRAKVKRRSALELQKVLKSEGTYSSSLDGYYGPGTSAAYQKAIRNNRDFQKYALISEQFPQTVQTTSRLQQAINTLNVDPNAIFVLESANVPIAKAYRAYQLFRTLGPSTEVNSLMNEAIKDAFSGKQLRNQPPFDYTATYSYQDVNQLILHIYYIHGAPGNEYGAPCWLADMYPKETSRAQAAFAAYDPGQLKLQTCDRLLDWEELRILQAIAADLNADRSVDQQRLTTDAARRAQLSHSPTPLNSMEEDAFQKWDQALWDGLNGWATRDPIHQQMVTALKLAYFQSQVRLEDYYMDKGFKAQEAKGLSLATLETLVGYYLERFI